MTIELKQLEESRRQLLLSVVRSALFVVTMHFRPDSFGQLSSDYQQAWMSLFKRFDDETIERLDSFECKACLEALHISLYGLGPFELFTITGKTLREYASAGLILADKVYEGVYLGTLWTEENFL